MVEPDIGAGAKGAARQKAGALINAECCMILEARAIALAAIGLWRVTFDRLVKEDAMAHQISSTVVRGTARMSRIAAVASLR